MWTWVLIVLLLWEIGLYLWRMIYGFPVSVEVRGGPCMRWCMPYLLRKQLEKG